MVTAIVGLIFLPCFAITFAQTQETPIAEQMAATVMTRWRDSWENQTGRSEKWSYDQGVVMMGLAGLWLHTANGEYFRFIQKSMDRNNC